MAEDIAMGALRAGRNGAGLGYGNRIRYSHSELGVLPALSSVLFRLDGLLSAPAIDLRELVRTVWNDPSIAAQVLYRALLEKAGDIPTRTESVLLVGAKALREIVVSTPIVLNAEPGASPLVALLRHSQAVSVLSERFALHMGTCSADRAAMLGLLHHIQPIPSPFGGRFVDCLSDSHEPALSQIVRAADRVANCCGYGLENNMHFPGERSKRDPGFRPSGFTCN